MYNKTRVGKPPEIDYGMSKDPGGAGGTGGTIILLKPKDTGGWFGNQEREVERNLKVE